MPVHICLSMVSLMLIHAFSFILTLASYNISVFGFVFFDEQMWVAYNKKLLMYLLLIEP